jgi:hypothetical protein
MRIKLYLFLPGDQALLLVQNGFPDSSKRFRLNPEEYTACSAFNPQSLVEVELEMEARELQRYRHELEMPVEDDLAEDAPAEDAPAADEEFGGSAAEPIYWYEFPASVLRLTCRTCRISSAGDRD